MKLPLQDSNNKVSRAAALLRGTWNHRILKSFRVGKTSKVIKSNHHPNPPMPAKPCPQVPHPDGF